MKIRKHILFYLNGQRHEIAGQQAGLMLADYLRYPLGLTGTKIVCAEGDCGACTVLRLFPKKKKNIYLPINSCITTLAQMDGSSLVTIDALAQLEAKPKTQAPHEREGYTPVQKAMMTCHGSQCGFCTPGFVMALTGLVEKKLCSSVASKSQTISQTISQTKSQTKSQKKSQEGSQTKSITEQEAKNSLTGNLCRCTGYQPIIEAARSIELSECNSVQDRFYSLPQQRDLIQTHRCPIHIQAEHFKFFAPINIKDAVNFLTKHKDTRLIGAGTDLGVIHNKRKLRLTNILSLHLIPELYEIKKLKTSRVSVGARVTLSELRLYLKDQIPEFARFLDLFASPQIKNLATLIGNVANASPIADTPPFLLTMNTEVEVQGVKGKRLISLDSFFISYRKTQLRHQEVITALHFDIPKKSEEIALYKVSQRKDLDISAVNFAFRLEWLDQKKAKIKNLKIAIGGVAATPLRLYKTEKALIDLAPTSENLAEALHSLHSEITPQSDLRGSKSFRHMVAENLFLKFFRERC